MRIPSQFNENSLYRRGTRRSDDAHTFRRIVRLVIGIALLALIMRQAARPAIYQTFFPDTPHQGITPPRPGMPGQTNSGKTLAVAAVGNAADSTATGAPRRIVPQDRAIARRVTDELLKSDQSEWVVALSRWQTGRSIDQIPSTIHSVLAILRDDGAIDPERQSDWIEMVELFQQSVDPEAASPLAEHHQAPLRAWLAALDDAAAADVADGSPWRSGDFATLYRYLDQANTLPVDGVAASGVLPLLQQPDVYRTRIVRVAGTIALVERIEAQQNPFGVTEYWQLWLRPSEGVDRPLLAIVPQVPPSIEALPTASEQDGPRVTMVGRFLKRWAYPSEEGVGLTPVVVGRLMLVPVSEAELAATIDTSADPTQANRFWLTVLLAVFIGISMTVIVIWRTSVAAKRAREIRTAHRAQPDKFLQELSDTLPEQPQ